MQALGQVCKVGISRNLQAKSECYIYLHFLLNATVLIFVDSDTECLSLTTWSALMFIFGGTQDSKYWLGGANK